MAKYQVCYSSTFFKAMDKLDRGTQKIIAKWIDKHLVNVDFPRAPGKYLSGNLSGYVRFRVGSYRIIAKVDEEDFVILNIHVAKRSKVYNFKGED
ncbi:Plasmid stabilization system protein [Streptococcus gordonii]|uniref:type II toxin-antitoxin system RelE family toxin n=1 Tax=Streptococcus gordonii TaxID=1302 RepID=UPI000F66064C|nr:type II toxin-antitoxin system RelE/ParE family toxin [Streptococcus gordonii]RSJ54030.1 Plasmid stabilization system protein [Streptococcus gordonii]